MNTSPTDLTTFFERTDRRRALKKMGFGALGMAALGLGAAEPRIQLKNPGTPGGSTPPGGSHTSLSSADLAILNFALNLEYLEANFYSYATTGEGIEAQGVPITGRGQAGAVTVPPTTMVTFSNPNVQAYANEITADEIAHVLFLRSVIESAGSQPIAQPAIDLVNSFNTAASAAGLGSSFSPFTSSANDLDFLLGAFIFEDVGVTAYHGAIPLISNPALVTGAGGIMGTEAYHASNIRTEIYKLGSGAISAAQDISNARNELGGEGLDQGVEVNGMANIVPADANAIVFARTTRLVQNIVYLGINASKGGFFPDGMNS